MRTALTAWLVGLLLLAAYPARPARARDLELSFYYATDFRRDRAMEDLERVWRRAAAAGYTRVMLADERFARPDAMDAHYRANVARARALAEQLHLAIVPGAFQVGRSNVMLGRDPDLAEGVPVRRALFVVRDGEARLVADPPVALGSRPDGSDAAVDVQGGIARMRDVGDRARFRFVVRVARFRCYHVSVRVRSRGFSGAAYVNVVGGTQGLNFIRPLAIQPTQDWTPYDIVLNSLDHDEITVHMGLWKPAQGELEWTDWRIEEVGLLNVLRRPGAPCIVEGRVEGRDYEPIRDPGLERVRDGGDYTEWHEPPVIRTTLPDGTPLRVSWYQPAFFYGGKTTCCPSDPGTLDLLRDEWRGLKELWGASACLLMIDEVRCLGWDPSCQARGRTPGEILAAHARACRELLEGNRLYAWSDMFDPFHNAHAGYFLVNGDLAGSWEGLDSTVVIVNWNFVHRAESLRFFAGRGHPQIIAGYYDGNPADIRDALVAARGVPGVMGVMYTTWKSRYDDLETFARIVRSEGP